MLDRFIRYYNKNRKEVIIIILAIVFGIAILQLLNYFAKRNNNNYSGQNNNSDSVVYQPEKSVLTGGTVPKKIFEKQSNIIDDFISECNEGKIQEAYSLLSDDCKNVMFPSLESFTKNYYNIIFTEKRDYSIENWSGSTYMVNMTHDLLATGKSNKGAVTQDYFTITDDNKLNINQFIELEELNKQKKDEHLEVKVLNRQKYMDYEIYNIYLKNITDKTIILDDLNNEGTIYLKDKNDIHHKAYNNELATSELTIEPQASINLSIKFANPYIQDRVIRSLTFSNAHTENIAIDMFNTKRIQSENFSFTINI